MANLIFRFRVALEDQEHVSRTIDILPTQTFLDFQSAIGSAFNFEVLSNPCFFKCDHNWIQSKKPILTDAVDPVEQVILKDKISDPHQKFYHIHHLEGGWNFRIELEKIIPSNSSIVDYPFVVDAKGKAPRQFPDAKKIAEEYGDVEEQEQMHDDEIIAEGSFDDMIIDQGSPEPEED